MNMKEGETLWKNMKEVGRLWIWKKVEDYEYERRWNIMKEYERRRAGCLVGVFVRLMKEEGKKKRDYAFTWFWLIGD